MKYIRKVLMGLILVSIVCISLFPIVYIVLHSLKGEQLIEVVYADKNIPISQKVLIKPFFINLNQYSHILLETPKFLYLFWNAFMIVLPIVLIQTGIGLLGAYGFSKLKFRGSDTLFFIYIIVMLMPFQVTLLPNYMMLNRLKLLDHYSALILPGIFSSFSTFFLKQFIEVIDNVYIEEARIEGASEIKIVTQIIGPMCKPIIVSIMVLLFVDYWSMIDQPIIFLFSKDKYPLSVYLSMIASTNIGISFACSVLYMALPVMLALYAQNDLSEGFRMSSLK